MSFWLFGDKKILKPFKAEHVLLYPGYSNNETYGEDNLTACGIAAAKEVYLVVSWFK